MPCPYPEPECECLKGAPRVVASAPNTPVRFSAGSRISDDDLLPKARLVMEPGTNGLTFGCKLRPRPIARARAVTEGIKGISGHYGMPDDH